MKKILFFLFVPIFCFGQKTNIDLKSFLKNIKTQKRDSFYQDYYLWGKDSLLFKDCHKLTLKTDVYERKLRLYFQKSLTNGSQNIIAVGESHYGGIAYFLITFDRKTKDVIDYLKIADHFVDAGDALINTAKFLSPTKFVIYDKDFSERPPNIPCNYTKTYYTISPKGYIVKGKSKKFNIKCK